jgi:glyoxylase-like metal-dependent hydrolase (beta-lactamase superfamily II)
VTYSLGLQELAADTFAYLQPHGGWGLSNAGLVVSGEHALLVDTLFDLAHTRRMLDAMKPVLGGPDINVVVNTHANGDHCYGNALLPRARIVASEQTAHELKEMPPARLALLMRAARLVTSLGSFGQAVGGAAGRMGLGLLRDFVEAAPYTLRAFGRFDFNGIPLAPPTETFTDRLELSVGERKVELIEVGPAHTAGDVVVHVPDVRVVFTGDILFEGMHPLVWAGPISGWIRACERIRELDPEIVVPGHGPVVKLDAVMRQEEYLRSLHAEAERRFAARVPLAEAAREIAQLTFGDRAEPERLFVNVANVYSELRGQQTRHHPIAAFAAIARLERTLQMKARP